jgi:beta-N-acetylhexosaminidase
MRKFKRFLTLSLALVMSVMCTVSMIPSAYAQQDEVASIVEQMTLEQKISQMMIPAIRTWDNVNVTDLDKAPELAAALRKHPYGGLILFAANILMLLFVFTGKGRKISRWEGALLTLGYVGFMWFSLVMQ